MLAMPKFPDLKKKKKKTRTRFVFWTHSSKRTVDGEYKVSAWTLKGHLVHRWAQDFVADATGVAIDPRNNTIRVSDVNNHRILVY